MTTLQKLAFSVVLCLLCCCGKGNNGGFIPNQPGSNNNNGGGGGGGGNGGGGGGGGGGGTAGTLTLSGTSPLVTSSANAVSFTFGGTSLSEASAISIQQTNANSVLLADPVSLTLNAATSTSISATLPANTNLPSGSYRVRVNFGSTVVVSSYVITISNLTTDTSFAGSTSGQGTLTPRPNFLDLGFINSDSFRDLAVVGGDETSNLTKVFNNTASSPVDFSVPTTASIASVTAPNGDAKGALHPSLKVANSSLLGAPSFVTIGTEDPEVRVHFPTGAGANIGFTVPNASNRQVLNTLIAGAATGNIPAGILYNNFDGDDIADLVVTSAGTPNDGNHKVLLLSNTAASANFPFSLTALQSLNGLANPLALAAGDFDSGGDLSLDVVVLNANGTVTVVLFDETGIPTSSSFNINTSILSPTGIGAGDFNNDGDQDVVVSGIGSTSSFLQVFSGNGNGVFTSVNTMEIGGILNALTVGDFNNDLRSDIAVSSSAGRVELFYSSFETLSSTNAFYRLTVTLSNLGEIFEHITNADLNNNGNSDIVVAARSTQGFAGINDVYVIIH
jgi:hypothetical protein